VVVYSPVAHWVWAPGGWLHKMGALDFAGGTVVHINAAAAALVFAVVLGRRRSLRQPTVLPHNVPFAILGAGLLWFGWLGFNGGSALAANGLAAYAFANTFFAPAAAALAWGLAELLLFHGKMSGVGIASGAVAGLVAITPASGFVGPLGSLAIGAAAGVVCYWGVTGLKHMFGYDDALDAFGVHGVGGITGALLTGVFAVEQYGGTAGLLEGNPGQVLNQIYGIVIVIVYCAVVSFIILKVIDMIIGLRVTKEVEQEGLDLALHGEAVQ
jgi:Amt family ammonium transporter